MKLQLKKYREMSNKTHVDAAAACGVSVSMIYKYENGDSVPSFNSMIALSKLYGVDIYLLGGEDRPIINTLPYLTSLLIPASKVSPAPLTNDMAHFDALRRISQNLNVCVSDLINIVRSIDTNHFLYPAAVELYQEVIEICQK